MSVLGLVLFILDPINLHVYTLTSCDNLAFELFSIFPSCLQVLHCLFYFLLCYSLLLADYCYVYSLPRQTIYIIKAGFGIQPLLL